jgi:protein-L-isoaspartate(D-aspartate) O-methyltransferase
MVRRQLFGRGIRDRSILRAFLRVDRELFVGIGLCAEAHGDHPVPIGHGQTVSQPYMVATMLEALRLRPGMKVLEVGAGSGYALALLLAMGTRPFGVEWVPDLAAAIPARLRAAGFEPPPVRVGDGGLGCPEESPFDRILVSAACPEVPPPLLAQLTPDGVLVAPVGTLHGQGLMRVSRGPAGLRSEDLGGCVFVPLHGTYGF